MSRRRRQAKRQIVDDPIYGLKSVSKFINALMIGGKKTTAEKIFYNSFSLIKDKSKEDPVKVFNEAIKNVKPNLEVKSRRVGGANYQVPIEIRPARRQALAMRWIVDAARKRSEKSMNLRLAGELLDASQKKGSAVRKREDVHKMAEANKAFSHFRF